MKKPVSYRHSFILFSTNILVRHVTGGSRWAECSMVIFDELTTLQLKYFYALGLDAQASVRTRLAYTKMKRKQTPSGSTVPTDIAEEILNILLNIFFQENLLSNDNVPSAKEKKSQNKLIPFICWKKFLQQERR